MSGIEFFFLTIINVAILYGLTIGVIKIYKWWNKDKKNKKDKDKENE